MASPEYDLGEVQPLQLPVSSLHSKDEPLSSAMKEKLAAVEAVFAPGPSVIKVSGGVVSGGGGVTTTVQIQTAGVASTFPAASFARAEKV